MLGLQQQKARTSETIKTLDLLMLSRRGLTEWVPTTDQAALKTLHDVDESIDIAAPT